MARSHHLVEEGSQARQHSCGPQQYEAILPHYFPCLYRLPERTVNYNVVSATHCRSTIILSAISTLLLLSVLFCYIWIYNCNCHQHRLFSKRHCSAYTTPQVTNERWKREPEALERVAIKETSPSRKRNCSLAVCFFCLIILSLPFPLSFAPVVPTRFTPRDHYPPLWVCPVLCHFPPPLRQLSCH